MTWRAVVLLAGTSLAMLAEGPPRAAGMALVAVAVAEMALRVVVWWRGRRRSKTLAGLCAMEPGAFERAVGAWLARDGWLVEHRGRSGDDGIDLLAFHGAQVLAIQCKRYAEHAAVSPAQVRELYGAATAVGATVALLVTTGRVAPGAVSWREGLNGSSPRLEFLAGQAVAEVATGRRRLSPLSAI